MHTTLAILFLLTLAAGMEAASAQPAPANLVEIDPANVPPGITAPEAINSHVVSAADYPVESVAVQETGTTILRYVVLEDGSIGPTEVVSSSGSQRLDDAAAMIVRRWRFTPATQIGRPIRVWLRANVVFNLAPGPGPGP